MARYLVAIYRPEKYDPAVSEDETMGREIDVLNEEMVAAGKVAVTDGPYAETNEHIGGSWVLEVADLGEALAWGRKAAVACGASVEVRPFHSAE